eukprot:9197147-Pyramimonas_sp.AAC.1
MGCRTLSRGFPNIGHEKHVVNDRNTHGLILNGVQMPVGDDNDGGTCENWGCKPGAFLYAICKKSGPF